MHLRRRTAGGAIFLSQKLGIPQTSIGRVLLDLEKKGYLQKAGSQGRTVTAEGIKYLEREKSRSLKLNGLVRLANMVESTSKQRLVEILRIRKLLEGMAVEDACENATEEQIEELRAYLDEYRRAVTSGGLGNDEDLALHLAVARCSGDSVLRQLMNLLLTEESGFVVYYKREMLSDSADLSSHERVVEAIEKRDAAAARAAMESHLDRLLRYVTENYDS